MHKLRPNINISKIAQSDVLQSVMLMIANKKVPSCFMDFVTGLVLIDQDAFFSKSRLEEVFKRFYPRLFNNTTFDGKTIRPFDYFFDNCQYNFYSTTGLIKKIDNDRYQVNHVLSRLSIKTPHKHLYNLRLNNQIFEQYEGNVTNIIKDCNWKVIETLVMNCKGVVFTYALIQNIFGLTRTDVKNYLRKTKSCKCNVYRTIGKAEQSDLELDTNLLGSKKNYKMIRGFTIDIGQSLDINIRINNSALSSIKDRLEKTQFKYSVKDFFVFATDASRPKLNQNECNVFNDQYERLGFSCVANKHSQDSLKKYVENVNLGSFKQMKNVYSWLNHNFDPDKTNFKKTFKQTYNGLLKRFVYQF